MPAIPDGCSDTKCSLARLHKVLVDIDISHSTSSCSAYFLLRMRKIGWARALWLWQSCDGTIYGVHVRINLHVNLRRSFGICPHTSAVNCLDFPTKAEGWLSQTCRALEVCFLTDLSGWARGCYGQWRTVTSRPPRRWLRRYGVVTPTGPPRKSLHSCKQFWY